MNRRELQRLGQQIEWRERSLRWMRTAADNISLLGSEAIHSREVVRFDSVARRAERIFLRKGRERKNGRG